MRNLFRAFAVLTALAFVAPAFAADEPAPGDTTSQPAPKTKKKAVKKASKKHAKKTGDDAAAPK
jgi:hypothetical protein